MFDLGFVEMLVVGIIALLVLGPERLPVAVRTVGLTIGRIKRGFADVQAQVEREIGADEIRQQLHNEKILKNLAKQEPKQTPEPAQAEAGPEAEEQPKRPASNVRRPAPVTEAQDQAQVDLFEPGAEPAIPSDAQAPAPATAAPDSAVEEASNRPHER